MRDPTTQSKVTYQLPQNAQNFVRPTSHLKLRASITKCHVNFLSAFKIKIFKSHSDEILKYNNIFRTNSLKYFASVIIITGIMIISNENVVN